MNIRQQGTAIESYHSEKDNGNLAEMDSHILQYLKDWAMPVRQPILQPLPRMT